MSTPADSNKATTTLGPESPTTARPLEMDDDDVQEIGVLEPSAASGTAAATTGSTAAALATDEAAPPKPPRPVSEFQKNMIMLKEAFPSIEEGVIKAVLTASGGRIDPAFNALLEMTDPDAASREVVEEPPPPQPPRPQALSPQAQLEADELYARQLAQHYENVGAYEARTSSRSGGVGGAGGRPPRQQTGLDPDRNIRPGSSEREHSFVEDDLPVIRENLRKGFQETQKTVNSWFQTMKKRFDEEFNEDDQHQHQQGHGQGQPQQGPHGHPQAGRRPGEPARRSGDYDRYDADPQVLSDDFAGMKFHSDGTPIRDTHAHQNPNLFRPPPPSTSPKPPGAADGRKVAFREGVDDIGDPYDASPRIPPKDGAAAGASAPTPATKSSKWQPLSTVEPSPIAENDPFSLGDSDDERDGHAGAAGGHSRSNSKKGGEIKLEDSERLRAAAAEAMNESLVDEAGKKGGVGDAAKKD